MMKRFPFAICALLLMTSIANAECLVFKGTFKGGKVYTQSNGASNVERSNEQGAYLIVEYSPSPEAYGNAYLVKFSKRGTERFYTVDNFNASFEVSFVNGRKRVIITDISNTEAEKDFIVMISGKYVFRRQVTEDYPIPSNIKGSDIYEQVNDLGERQITSQFINLKLANKWTSENFTSTSAAVLASVSDQLTAKGYKLKD